MNMNILELAEKKQWKEFFQHIEWGYQLADLYDRSLKTAKDPKLKTKNYFEKILELRTPKLERKVVNL